MTTPPPPAAPLLRVGDLHAAWPLPHRTREVLRGVDLVVQPGQILAVVGPSGAGKSVLARSLLGLLQREGAVVRAQRLELAGQDLTGASQRTWRQHRGRTVALVQQDALQSLDPLRTIAAETAEALTIHRIPERRSRVLRALERAGLPGGPRLLARRPGQLSGGQRQRAVIAGAIAATVPLLIADEPTTALDATTGRRVLALLRSLADDGAGVLLISHDLAAVGAVADRVAVLDAGRIVEEGTATQVLADPQSATARALRDAAPRGPKPAPSPAADGSVLVHAADLIKRFPASGGGAVTALAGVDVAVRAGRVLGVVGESGSGKTTLARLLVGAECPDAGAVRFPSGPVRVRLVPQDPLGSFDPRWTVGRIVEMSRRDGSASPADLLGQVGLPAQALGRRPAVLSGGQRQRVAIARALAGRPDVLVCDEPTSALDVVTQAGILELLRRLQRDAGLAIVFVSHDLAVVRQVADDVVVMQNGTAVERGAVEEVFAHPQQAFTRDLLAAASYSTGA